MKTFSIFFVLFVSLLFAFADSTYQQMVPQELQSLVTEEMFTSRLDRMHAAANKLLPETILQNAAASPCGECLAKFMEAYAADPEVSNALDAVVSGLQTPPAYMKSANPWAVSNSGEALYAQLVKTFTDWCTWLPQIQGDQDDGLKFI